MGENSTTNQYWLLHHEYELKYDLHKNKLLWSLNCVSQELLEQLQYLIKLYQINYYYMLFIKIK